MKKYLVKKGNSSSYVTTIYRTSINTSSDIGDALELTTIEDARVIKKLVEERHSDEFCIVCIETTISSVDLNED